MRKIVLSVLSIALACPAAAQVREPYGDPVLRLLSGPADGLSYRRARERAEALIAENRFVEALPIARSLVDDYPRDGVNWILLGRASAGAGDHTQAADAYGEAGKRLGWRTPYYMPGVQQALAQLNAGDLEGSLSTLSTEIHERQNFYLRTRLLAWPGFEALRQDPRFLALAGQAAGPIDAAEARRRDLDYLRAEILRVDPDHHDAPLPQAFESRFVALRATAASLTDAEFFVSIGALLSTLQHGHTAFFPPADAPVLPLRFYAFPDGVYVVQAEEGHSGLVGRRLIGIGGVATDVALDRLAAHRSVDGPMQHVWGVNDLASMTWLEGLHLLTMGGADLEFEGPDGARTTVRLSGIRPSGGRQDRLPAPPGAPAPLWLGNIDDAHWISDSLGPSTVYAQFNQVRSKPGQTVAGFGLALRERIEHPSVKHVILDLRHNNGGDTNSYREVLRTLIAFKARPGTAIFVLIGRRTYSATANLVTDLERLVEPVFVGEATSACCHFYGDPAQVILPYSGLRGEISSVRWNLSYDVFDGRRELSPDVPVQLSAENYFAGSDPVLEAAIRLIGEREAGSF